VRGQERGNGLPARPDAALRRIYPAVQYPPGNADIGNADAPAVGRPLACNVSRFPARERHGLVGLDGHAQRLAHLIDDLLAISRLEAGTPVERRPVAIGEVVAEVCGLLEESFCGAGVALTCHIDANLAPWRGDRRAVEEILTNLLDNARGYTPAGGAVEVRLAATDHGVALRVRDTGIGIAAEHLDRIFERFYRVDPARSRAAGGTGLGLALVKHLTDALGGKVAVASEVGVGTTFTVELPYGEERPS